MYYTKGRCASRVCQYETYNPPTRVTRLWRTQSRPTCIALYHRIITRSRGIIIIVIIIGRKSYTRTTSHDIVVDDGVVLNAHAYPTEDNVITRVHTRAQREGGGSRVRSWTSIKQGTVDRRKTNIITGSGAFWKVISI